MYDGDKLVSKKEMNKSISHGNSSIAEFDYLLPASYSGVTLKGVIEAANDADTSNNTCELKLSFVDLEITNLYNALYEKNRGYVYVDVTNNGFATVHSAKLEIYTDKDFKNLVSSKEIKNLYPSLTKKLTIEFAVSDEQIEERLRLYVKVVVDEPEFDYTNNSGFTIVRPYDFNFIPGTATPEPTPVTPEPTPVTPKPTPVTPEPTPVTPEPTPVTPEPTPGTEGTGSSGTGSSGTEGTTGSAPTPTPTPTPSPDIEIIETPDPNIPGGDGKHKGYMRGYEDKSFRPENNITRAEMAVILANLDEVTKGGLESTTFKDVSDKHWAAWAIEHVVQKGYFKGYEDSTFRPDKYITRAELSVVLCKYLELNGIDATENSLTDITGHWAEGYINMLTSKGYIKGYSDKTFRPDNNIKRSECTALINRALGIEMPDKVESQFTDVDKNHWAYKDIMAATQN
ncbi:MAG: Cellulosome-anchoring protein precursor [Firmicutes bacterium ADurb.Bin419]|nr:MAG: Cellulosome-anchoring protein precursor [Firmicutes bacterium ADurb.Bin419]